MKIFRRKFGLLLLLLFCLFIGSTFKLFVQQHHHNHESSSSLLPISNDLPSSNGKKKELSFGTFDLTIHNQTFDYRYSSKLPLSRGSNLKSEPSIVFGILSAPNNVAARQAIRASWGKEEALFFVLGGETYTSEINLELRTFHDIVFVDAPEDYRSGLTRKTMLILHFFHHLYNENCKKDDWETSTTCYDFLFKTDDDSYVNTTQLRFELSGKDPTTGEAIAFYGEPSVKTEPDRNTSSRFYISHEEYSAKFYPPYAFGMGYALSSPLVACVCQQMRKVRKQLPWEDVATGSLVKKCGFKLTWANWSLPGYPAKFQVQYFPYEILKPGGFSVTLVHGVKNPDWMMLLHLQKPLP
ncbi:unnamed protein product [Cylindrotheca closterium]|uniref:Hexosyltransferase n=1 Tax=Cylindrotheca closterium TaxID=2856 RepID=A0AAD2FMY8_9STRA|nr:unnamed protein product [Cylindrotheca closterium]